VPRSPSGTDPQWRDPATGDATERTAPVQSPGELISLVPYLLGFHPGGGDMVVMGTAPPGNRVRLTLRWDLPGPDVPALAAAHARHAIVVLAVNGCTQVAAVGFGPDQLVAPSVMVLREAATAAGLRAWDLLRADGGRYWSYQCDSPACCPPGGTPCSSAGGPTAAVFEVAGTRVLASRDELAATIAPAGGAQASSMRSAVQRATRRSARNIAAAARRRTKGKESRPHATAGHQAVKAAVRAYQAGGSITGPDELAGLAVAVSRIPVRDLAWTLMDPAHRDAHLRLWTDLTRIAGPGLTAAPATLLALCAWQAGNGALAQIALDRALDDDPGYLMAGLLRTAVACAAPPSLADPALILPRIAAATGSPPGTDA